MKKQLCLLLAVLIGVTVCFGCSGNTDNPTVMVIGGEKIALDEFNYFYYNSKADYDRGDESYWNDPAHVKALDDEVLFALRRNHAIKEQAKKYKISLSSDVKNSIENAVNKTKESYADVSEFYNSLDSNHMSERMFGQMLELNQLWRLLYEHVTNEASGIIHADDATLLADIPKNFYRATHILIMNDEGDVPSVNRVLAEKLLGQLKDGGDFEALKDQYGEDTGVKGNPDGYYFTEGQMIKSFGDTVKSLGIGETSGVVESQYGYHIIRRLPLEDVYINTHLEELREAYMARIFNEELKADAESYNAEYTDAYRALEIPSNKLSNSDETT